MDKDATLAGCFGLVGATIALVVISSIVGGWALSVIWGWFIVPIFGLPSLTIAQAIGVGLVIGSSSSSRLEVKEGEGWIKAMFKATIASAGSPLIMVGVAYAVQLFL